MSQASRSRPVTPAYLDRAALAYLARYSSTAENLRGVLRRKARRRLADQPTDFDLEAAIDDTVARAVRSGLIDDRLFAESAVAGLERRGASPGAMRQRLRHKGVPPEIADRALGGRTQDDLALARRFAERKRLGPFRPRPDPDRRDRDLAALCRAGFSYRIAVAALESSD